VGVKQAFPFEFLFNNPIPLLSPFPLIRGRGKIISLEGAKPL